MGKPTKIFPDSTPAQHLGSREPRSFGVRWLAIAFAALATRRQNRTAFSGPEETGRAFGI
jgi:hypothetical protein